jgi:hypothetical protein
MRVYGGVDVQYISMYSPCVGTSLKWVVCFTMRPLYPRGDSCTHWIAGWVGLKSGTDDVEKRRISLLPGLELGALYRPSRSQSLYWLHPPSTFHGTLHESDWLYKCITEKQNSRNNFIFIMCEMSAKVPNYNLWNYGLSWEQFPTWFKYIN